MIIVCARFRPRIPGGYRLMPPLKRIWKRCSARWLPGRIKLEPLRLRAANIACRRRAPGVIWFDFMKLCGDQRGQADYLQLARQYHTVLVSGIPRLEARQASEARRLTWLVDVFYDHRVKLVVSADAVPDEIYVDGQQASEFFRTVSRLTEMQTNEYLALPHEPLITTLSGLIET